MNDSAGDAFVRFGPGRSLVGILSGDPASRGPVLVLPSAGLLPRAGPFRAHVDLARRLAHHGIRTFRFDVPGVGEAPRIDGIDGTAATLAALDALAHAHGCSHFVVGGLCAGADVGWRAAVADPRVCGILMLDGIGYAGPWYRVGRVLNVVRGGATAVLKALVRRARLPRGAAPMGSVTDYREWPSREQAKLELSRLVERGVHAMFIYTGGYRDVFTHARQFSWAFGRTANSARVTMHFWRDCDHTLYAAPHRARFLDTVEQWMLALGAPEAGR